MSEKQKLIRDFVFVMFVMMLLFSVALAQPGYVVKVSPHDSNNSSSVGTGSIIRYDLVLTAQHVVRDRIKGRLVPVTFVGGSVSQGKVIKESKERDLALLRIPRTLMPIIKVGSDPSSGQMVNISGFAHGNHFQTVTGEVVGWYSNTEHGLPRVFRVNKESISGMSGGPVTIDGRLVGILFGAHTDYSMCPSARSINEFLADFDLLKEKQ